MLVSTHFVPRNWRIRLGVLRTAKWLVPAFRCLALPVAVSRNRFLVALCVFSLDIGQQTLLEQKEWLIRYLGKGCR